MPKVVLNYLQLSAQCMLSILFHMEIFGFFAKHLKLRVATDVHPHSCLHYIYYNMYLYYKYVYYNI